MVRLEAYKLALSNAAMPPKAEWQATIDRRCFLFPFGLGDIQLGAKGPCSASINGEPTTFECVLGSVESVAGNRHPDLRESWSFVHGFRGTGGLVASAAAGLAWLSYALATDGMLYSPKSGTFRQWDLQQQAMEAVLASEFGRIDLYRARYPWNDKDHPDGPGVVMSRIAAA